MNYFGDTTLNTAALTVFMLAFGGYFILSDYCKKREPHFDEKLSNEAIEQLKLLGPFQLMKLKANKKGSAKGEQLLTSKDILTLARLLYRYIYKVKKAVFDDIQKERERFFINQNWPYFEQMHD